MRAALGLEGVPVFFKAGNSLTAGCYAAASKQREGCGWCNLPGVPSPPCAGASVADGFSLYRHLGQKKLCSVRGQLTV